MSHLEEKKMSKIQLFSNSPSIYFPYYIDEQRQQIRAFVKFNDGRIEEMDVPVNDDQSQFLRDIWAQNSEEEVLTNTLKERQIEEARSLLKKRQEEDQKYEAKKEALFQAKSEALNSGLVPSDIALRIRKALTPTEVYSLVAFAMLKTEIRE